MYQTGYQPTLKIYGKPVTQSRKIAAFATDPSLDVNYSGTTVRMSYDYPPLLREIQDLVEAKLDVKFNHVMLNLYENGRALFPSLFRSGERRGASPDEASPCGTGRDLHRQPSRQPRKQVSSQHARTEIHALVLGRTGERGRPAGGLIRFLFNAPLRAWLNRVIASLSLGAPRTFILTHDKTPPLASSSSLSSASLPKAAAAKKKTRAARSESATMRPTLPSPPPPSSASGVATVKDDDDHHGDVTDASSRAPPPPQPLVYSHRFTLENGSLVVMQGTMQQHWKHQIPKEKLVTQSRISLTFRQLVF
jgi:alkylated DNA repair dioxygenase AlkB